MAISEEGALKAMIIIIHYVTWPASLTMGITSLLAMSSGASGFKFLGISFLVIGIIVFFLFCVDCVSADRADLEVLFAFGSLCGLLLYLLMLSLCIFALAVSIQGTGKSLPGIKYKEYELHSYSKWLQNKVNNSHSWEKYYKTTLIKHHACSDMNGIYRLDTLDKFHQRPLNSFESGCCKPPEECKFNYTSPTIWTNNTTNKYTNEDCYKWNNDIDTYCFNCQSCKAAFAQDVKDKWSLVRIIGIILLAKFALAALLCGLGISFGD